MSVRSKSASRERILGGIRKSVGAAPDDADRRVTIQKRLYDHTAHIIPERAQKAQDALIDQFESILQGQSATVTRVASHENIAPVVANYLRDHNLPARLRHGGDERLERIDWSAASHIDRLTGPAHPDDVVSLSHAFGGASETGTLFMVSGEENPTTLNFLPETHIVVVSSRDVVGPYEEVWTQIRETYGERTMPRTVNLISGPSRTGDIEQILVMGAHGPKRLHVIIVEDY